MKANTSWTIVAVSGLLLLLPSPTSSFVAPSCQVSAGCRTVPAALTLDMVSVIQTSADAVTFDTTEDLIALQLEGLLPTTQDEGERTIPFVPESARFPAIVAAAVIATAANQGWQVTDAGIPVAESLLALVASVATVSFLTAAVEVVTAVKAQGVPAFSSSSQRFDPTSFGGRFCHMLLACDPRLLLYGEDQVREYQGWIQNYEYVQTLEPQQSPMTATTALINDRQLWEARRIVDSALHPETNEWIPRACRMSGYVPFNGPICVGMVASQSTLALLFFSWLNQSQNAFVNYANRSSSSAATTNAMLLKSYATAVGSALLITWGLATFVNSQYTGEEAATLLRFISFPSAVVASSLNCFVVRSPEIDAGVPLLENVQDKQTVLPGETSNIAAKRGVYATTASRALLQFPTYFFPPLILDTVQPLKQYMCDQPSTVVPLTTFVLLVVFGIGLPLVIGMLPQYSKIKVEDVEPKFAELGLKEFCFDKGL